MIDRLESAAIARARIRAACALWKIDQACANTIAAADLPLYVDLLTTGDDSLELALRLRARAPGCQSLPLTIPDWVAALGNATADRKKALWALAPESTKTALIRHKQRMTA